VDRLAAGPGSGGQLPSQLDRATPELLRWESTYAAYTSYEAAAQLLGQAFRSAGNCTLSPSASTRSPSASTRGTSPSGKT
jgi:hypothetical protein